MRRIALLSAVAGIALIAACSKAKDDVPAAPPPPPPPPANRVTITLTCPNDGGKIGVHPWRINVTKDDGVEWFLGANDKSVWITPKDTAVWPFDGDTINVASGNSVKSTNFKTTVEKGTYRYVVTGVCDNANGPDTVVLDPDMIIPTKIQTR